MGLINQSIFYLEAIKKKYPTRPLTAYSEAKASFNNMANEWSSKRKSVDTKDQTAEHVQASTPVHDETTQLEVPSCELRVEVPLKKPPNKRKRLSSSKKNSGAIVVDA